MFGIGAGEFIIIVIAGLILFGPGKLPELGRAIGKGLSEFRKAQSALSATLNEVSLESTPPPAEKKVTLSKAETETEVQKPATMSVDEVINLAKENPINKENVNEKNSDGGIVDVATSDNNASNVNSTSNADSTAKQSQPTKN